MAGKSSHKDKMKKRLEMLRKASEIDAILQRGDIEEQALTTGGGESRPADESHMMDLLEGANQSNSLMIKPSANATSAYSTRTSRSIPRSAALGSSRSRAKPKGQKPAKKARVRAKPKKAKKHAVVHRSKKHAVKAAKNRRR